MATIFIGHPTSDEDLPMVPTDILAQEALIKKHDPGGKVSIRLAAQVQGTAIFGGRSKEYRYRLSYADRRRRRT